MKLAMEFSIFVKSFLNLISNEFTKPDACTFLLTFIEFVGELLLMPMFGDMIFMVKSRSKRVSFAFIFLQIIIVLCTLINLP